MGALVAGDKSMASPIHPPARPQHRDGHRLQGNAFLEITVTYQLSAPQFDPLPKHW